jgi:hypothetical protein
MSSPCFHSAASETLHLDRRSRPLTRSLPSLRDQHWKEFLAQGNSDSFKPVYIHGESLSVAKRPPPNATDSLPLGFVYDISTGYIYDLNVSQGPPGYNGDSSK